MMKLSVVLLVAALAARSDAAESNLYRGARGSRNSEDRQRLLMGPAPTNAPISTAAFASSSTTEKMETGKGESMGKGMEGKGNHLPRDRLDAFIDFFFDSPPCPECRQELPGYSFFGDLYFENDFFLEVDYEAAVFASRKGETIVPLGPFGGRDLLPFDPFEQATCVFDPRDECQNLGIITEIPEDCATVFSETPIPQADLIKYQTNFTTCKFVACVSEIVYRVDLTRCLLLSILKAAREIVCYLLDLSPFPLNPDLTTGRKLSETDSRRLQRVDAVRKLNEVNGAGDTLETLDGVLMVLDMLGITNMQGMLDMFNITETLEGYCGIDLPPCPFGDFDCPPVNRKLSPDSEGTPFIEVINDLVNSFLNANTEQVIESNFFFDKCIRIYEQDFATCALIFALFKTTDASVCYYKDELGCNVDEHCTKDLAFTTEYSKRRLANYLPSVGGFITGSPDPNPIPFPNPKSNQTKFDYTSISEFLLADILAPCTTCASEKNPCAPFCNYADGFESCDVFKRLYLKEIFPPPTKGGGMYGGAKP